MSLGDVTGRCHYYIWHQLTAALLGCRGVPRPHWGSEVQIEGQIHSEGQITVRVPSEERVKGQTPSDRLITVPVPSEGPWAGRVPSEAVPPPCGS